MTDRPILFSASMVRALLGGRKTQTRISNGGTAPTLNVGGLLQSKNRLERHFAEDFAVCGGDFEALPVDHLVGHKLLRKHLACGLHRLVIGLVKRWEFRPFRVLLKGIRLSDVEIVSGHGTSLTPSQENAFAVTRFPLRQARHLHDRRDAYAAMRTGACPFGGAFIATPCRAGSHIQADLLNHEVWRV